MKKKPANLSSGLVAVKGQAAAGADATPRQLETPAAVAATGNEAKPTPAANAPLNFKVDADFRRRFRQCALGADLKLNELLRQALDAWEEKHLSK